MVCHNKVFDIIIDKLANRKWKKIHLSLLYNLDPLNLNISAFNHLHQATIQFTKRLTTQKKSISYAYEYRYKLDLKKP